VEDGFVATVEDENSGGNTITQKRTQKAQEPNPKAQTQYTRISDPSEHTPPRAHALTRTGLRERERGRDSGSPPWPAVLTRGREGEVQPGLQRGAKEAALSKAAAALQSEQELEARLPVVLLPHAVVITEDVYCTV
jgi:hypothetical protein